jgi:hypothetical protein
VSDVRVSLYRTLTTLTRSPQRPRDVPPDGPRHPDPLAAGPPGDISLSELAAQRAARYLMRGHSTGENAMTDRRTGNRGGNSG